MSEQTFLRKSSLFTYFKYYCFIFLIPLFILLSIGTTVDALANWSGVEKFWHDTIGFGMILIIFHSPKFLADVKRLSKFRPGNYILKIHEDKIMWQNNTVPIPNVERAEITSKGFLFQTQMLSLYGHEGHSLLEIPFFEKYDATDLLYTLKERVELVVPDAI